MDNFPKYLVLPVSGQGVVEQIGILSFLMSSGYKPNISMGASGGAILAAIAISFDWNSNEILDWINKIPSSEILKEKFFGIISGFNSSSIYNVGSGLEYIFKHTSKKEFESKFREQELLISVQNQTLGRLEIFSTVNSEKSILKKSKGPLNIFGTSCFISYLGDLNSTEYLKKFEKVIRATSAIPSIFPPIEIDNFQYIDGGVGFSSPLNPVTSLIKNKEILYIFPDDIEVPLILNNNTAYDSLMNHFSQVSRSNYIHDRSIFLSGLCSGDFNSLKLVKGSSNELKEALMKTKNKNRLVELFPNNNIQSLITNKTSKNEMIKRIKENISSFKFRIFYI